MNLYCWQHHTVHALTAGEVEQAFYALVAAHTDAVIEPDGDRMFAGDAADGHYACPVEVLRWARNCEVYAEHVEQGLTCARATDPTQDQPEDPTPDRNQPRPGSGVGRVQGQRSVRFQARFDSSCSGCRELIEAGEDVAWLDGEVVHEECAVQAGVEVFDRAR